jgi:Protein of unknown function (DUF2778)
VPTLPQLTYSIRGDGDAVCRGVRRTTQERGRDVLVRVGEVSVAAGLAGLTVIGMCAWTLHGSDSADAKARAGISVFGTIHPPLLDYGNDALQSEAPRRSGVHLASLGGASDSPATTGSIASFEDRFAPDRASFEDRFGIPPSGTLAVKTVAVPVAMPVVAAAAPTPSGEPATRGLRLAAAIPLPRPAPRDAAVKPSQMRYRVASLSAMPAPSAYAPADATKESDAPDKDANPLAGDLSHTAIYDISARTVYLPNGERLEAHSGLGDYMDDIRAVHLRKRGPTPPNVYELRMRESLFHGVQAIRLVPVDGSKMYGRDGMLAHPFMLRANGESNGCVSFKDYPAFLKAFQRGDVTRMVVVEQLDEPPGGRTAGDWFSSTLKKLFGRS